MPNKRYQELQLSSQKKLEMSAEQIRSLIPTSGEIGILIEEMFRSYLAEVFREDSDITHIQKLFGEKKAHWKSIFFCISVESISFVRLMQKYKEIVEKEDLDFMMRIDTIFSLESTDNINIITNYNGAYDFLPGNYSQLHAIYVDRSWAFFINLLLRYMVHAQAEPINMLEYGGKTLHDYAKYKL